MQQTEQDSLLEQAVINQLEKDIEENEFDAMSELIRQLILLEPARKCLLDYLSDEVKEEWLNGDMKITY